MQWYNKFKQRFRNFGIPNLMTYIILAMVAVFLAEGLFGMPLSTQWLSLDRDRIFSGEIWRLVTFLFIPDTRNILWFIISIMFYSFVGNSLEHHWGSSTFTLYYLMGAGCAIIAALITGYGSNSYLNMSLFFAFAFLFPDTQFRVSLIIPIKAKYLAIVDGIFYLISLIVSIATRNWHMLAALIASLANFAIFFGPSMINRFTERQTIKRRQKEYRRELRRGNDDDFRKQ